MGGDGGSIITRDTYVKVKRLRETAVDPQLALEQKSAQCYITTRQLKRPIVFDELGNIYNKQAVLEHLLSKKDVPSLRHIRGLKDIFEGKATFVSETNTGSSNDMSKSLLLDHIICPITKTIFNGRHPFIAMRDCGCILSLNCYRELVNEKQIRNALKIHTMEDILAQKTQVEVPECPVCGSPIPLKYLSDDIETGETPYIQLNSPENIVDQLRNIMFAKREKTINKKLKKKEKGKKNGKNNELIDEQPPPSKKQAGDGLLRIAEQKADINDPVIQLDNVKNIVQKARENIEQKKQTSQAYKSIW